ncbi:MAG: tripartite tricarboxylate transporter substrate binding protein [Burkholderiaceae bacterium]|nr:tripartite tricarboxylate transporter substrate binding protein [Burkholderiaceae bacterium]
MIQRRHALLGLGAACAVPHTAWSQGASWPSKPVKLLVAFAPGGPADIIARMLALRLSERIKQPVVVENRGGAGGNVAAQAVARAEPDGYTLLITTSAFAVNPALSRKAGYDPLKDFATVNIVAGTPNLLVASPALPVKTLQDVFKLAKTQNLSFGTAGGGTTPHLSAEYLFKSLAKVNIVHAPFTGAGPALTAVMGNQIQLASVALPAAVALVKADKVRPLAVTSARRVSSMPDVPTVAEQFPGFSFATWVGLFAPAKTPAAIVERLNSELNLALFIPEFQQQLDKAGFSPIGGSLNKASEYLKAELVKYAKVVKETGVTAD